MFQQCWDFVFIPESWKGGLIKLIPKVLSPKSFHNGVLFHWWEGYTKCFQRHYPIYLRNSYLNLFTHLNMVLLQAEIYCIMYWTFKCISIMLNIHIKKWLWANIDPWDLSTKVILRRLSFLRRDIHILKNQISMCE